MPPRIISILVTTLTIGFRAYPHRLFSEIISIPALQNADIELKMDIHIPAIPYSGTNTGIYKRAPIPSTSAVPIITFLINFTIPDRVFKLNAS